MPVPRGLRGTVLLAAIVLVGAVLRLVGIGWGLPQGLHPDEWVIVWGAVHMAEGHTFEPSFYFRPDHVEIKLSYLAYEAYAHLVVGSSVGPAHASDPGTFLLISRLISVAFGLAAIVLAWFVGRRIHPRVGVIAALLFATFPLYVEHAHYATPDVPLTAMVLGVILACQHYLAKPALASLLIACACTALAIATKYPGAIALVAIATVVVFAGVRDRRFARMAAHGGAAIAGVIVLLFAVSPVLFTNVGAVVRSIQTESRSVHPGADGLGFGGNLAFYAWLYLAAAGLLLAIAFLIGIVVVVKRRITSAIPIAIGVVFWAALSVVPLHWERWSLPMFTAPLLIGAVGIHACIQWSQRFAQARWRTPVLAAAGIAVAANLVASGVAIDARFVAPDSRLVSVDAVSSRGVTLKNTVAEGYSTLRPDYPHTIFDEVTVVDGSAVPTDRRARFVMTSSCMNDRFLAETRYVSQQALYAALANEGQPVLSYSSVPQWQRSPIEVLNIAGALNATAAFAGGGLSGCDLDVYALGG